MNYKTRKLVITLSIICILLFAFLTLTIILALSSCKSAAETSIAVSETEATAETIQETEPEITEAPTEEVKIISRETELPLEVKTSDLQWTCSNCQVENAMGSNQCYKVWVPNIDGPKDVLVMMHVSKNPLDNTGFPSDWVDHTYYFDGKSSTPWEIGDALAAIAEKKPFILVSPNYISWVDKDVPHDIANQDFLIPECQLKFLKDICSKFETYAQPTEESILENREHFLLGGASIGGNWTSLGLIRGLSRYYGNFFIGSDSTRYQTPLENLAEGLKRVAEPTLVWCIDGTMEGDHTRVTWNYLKDLSFDFAEVRHITILEGHHLYSTWLTALNYIMTNAF